MLVRLERDNTSIKVTEKWLTIFVSLFPTHNGVFDTAPSPLTGPDDDPHNLGQSFK